MFIAAAVIAALLAGWIVRIRRYYPSNLALAWLQSRRGLKWGVPAMLIALVYIYLGYWLHTQAQTTGEGWISVFAVVCAISAVKFAVNGPVTLLKLAAARIREARARRAAQREDAELAAA